MNDNQQLCQPQTVIENILTASLIQHQVTLLSDRGIVTHIFDGAPWQNEKIMQNNRK